MTRVLLIDNYDSFTFNVYHALASQGAELDVIRNDKITLPEVQERHYDAVVISPGPCTPKEAGISCPLIATLGASTPILGICLGMQAMGEVFGGRVVRAPQPMHGKISAITHKGQSVFRGLNAPLNVTRYHSLIVDRPTLPESLLITAESHDGLIMGLQHRTWPVHGVQFHPESIASESGALMFRNFLDIARSWRNAHP